MSSPLKYDVFLKNLRTCVREIRLEQAQTQKEFAEKNDHLNQSSIAKIEGGSSANIGLRIVYEIAQASCIPLSAIIERTERMSNKKNKKSNSWDSIEKAVQTFSPKKKEWLAKIVSDILSEAGDK